MLSGIQFGFDFTFLSGVDRHMSAKSVLPVIMAGGSGTRLWPMSRTLYPKQFLPLVGSLSMLEQTCLRLKGLVLDRGVVISGEDHRFIVAEQLRESGLSAEIILEPAGKNTAPAVALAALRALAANPNRDPVLLVLAADHVVKDVEAFQGAVERGYRLAEEGRLVTFGVVPASPETGYGYIRAGASFEEDDPEAARDVAEFVEKPDLDTAKQYLSSGNFYWNSGIFMFRATAYLDALEAHRPDILTACRNSMLEVNSDIDFIRPDKDTFLICPDDSVDYAVMEPRSAIEGCVAMVPLKCGWSDVGSWAALWEVSDKDESGNAVSGDVLVVDTRSSYLRSDSKLIAAVGVDNIVLVETDDAILVAHRDRVQDVKGVVAQIKAAGRSEHSVHRKVYRPWGYYDSIDAGERFQVKRIVVNPGASLSLQMHHHRAEHWIVVQGTAKVTKGEEVFLVSENQSTYIPLGVTHRLENPGVLPLEMIEVQSGSYLGEDDIVRFEDTYGRA